MPINAHHNHSENGSADRCDTHEIIECTMRFGEDPMIVKVVRRVEPGVARRNKQIRYG